MEAEFFVKMLIELVRAWATKEGCVFKVWLTAATSSLLLDAVRSLDKNAEVYIARATRSEDA
jgi:hypothetical protein